MKLYLGMYINLIFSVIVTELFLFRYMYMNNRTLYGTRPIYFAEVLGKKSSRNTQERQQIKWCCFINKVLLHTSLWLQWLLWLCVTVAFNWLITFLVSLIWQPHQQPQNLPDEAAPLLGMRSSLFSFLPSCLSKWALSKPSQKNISESIDSLTQKCVTSRTKKKESESNQLTHFCVNESINSLMFFRAASLFNV